MISFVFQVVGQAQNSASELDADPLATLARLVQEKQQQLERAGIQLEKQKQHGRGEAPLEKQQKQLQRGGTQEKKQEQLGREVTKQLKREGSPEERNTPFKSTEVGRNPVGREEKEQKDAILRPSGKHPEQLIQDGRRQQKSEESPKGLDLSTSRQEIKEQRLWDEFKENMEEETPKQLFDYGNRYEKQSKKAAKDSEQIYRTRTMELLSNRGVPQKVETNAEGTASKNRADMSSYLDMSSKTDMSSGSDMSSRPDMSSRDRRTGQQHKAVTSTSPTMDSMKGKGKKANAAVDSAGKSVDRGLEKEEEGVKEDRQRQERILQAEDVRIAAVPEPNSKNPVRIKIKERPTISRTAPGKI
jgi:hypothetical protein